MRAGVRLAEFNNVPVEYRSGVTFEPPGGGAIAP
jgi:hypothetical protein